MSSLPVGDAGEAGGVAAIVTGWGRTQVRGWRSFGDSFSFIQMSFQRDGNLADVLQSLRTTTLTNDQCKAQHSTLNRRFIFDSNICTANAVGQGFCTGDGGGPLVIGEGINRRAIGIVSWNMPCGTGTPDVYVRLSSYIPWINANV